MSEPKFPPGTPEYEAYVAELQEELRKFANREAPYDKEPSISPQQDAAMRRRLGMDVKDAQAVADHLGEIR